MENEDNRTDDDVRLLDDGWPPKSIGHLIANRWSSKGYRCCIGCLGFLALLFLCGSITLFATFQHIIENIVRKKIVLSPGNEIYDAWKSPPVPIYFRVFMFNITNQEDFPWQSKKPVVQELGPYVFREEWLRENIRFFPNDTLSYRKAKTYYFEPSLSNGSLDDMIHTVNIPLLTAAYLFKTSGPLVKFAMASVFHVLRENFITKRTTRELIFDGYDDALIKVGKEIFKTYPFSKFGYFFGKNGTDDGDFNIETGVRDSYRFTLINTWNGKTNMSLWNSSICDAINGTDGSSFPPLLDVSRRLYVFVTDLCRSIALDFKDSVERYKIPVNRYIPSKLFMDNGTLLPENECFCSGKCLKSGAYNLSLCQYGAPLFASFPHFYNADPSYLDAVQGLNPNSTIHETQFLIEPETGVPVEIGGRFQINAYLERIPGFLLFESIPNMLFPLIWFEETSLLDQDLANKLIAVTQTPYFYGRIVTYTLLIVGLVLGLGAVFYFVLIQTHKQRTESST